MCKEMPVIPVNGVVDKKRIIAKKGKNNGKKMEGHLRGMWGTSGLGLEFVLFTDAGTAENACVEISDAENRSLQLVATMAVPRGARVARWFVFKPKIPIWVNFGGP
jgi:hypothetical protein